MHEGMEIKFFRSILQLQLKYILLYIVTKFVMLDKLLVEHGKLFG